MPDVLATPDGRWLEAVSVRRSRRVYDGRRLPDDDAEALAGACETFRPYPDARIVFLREAPGTIFTGVVGSYGKVRGAPSAFVFVADAASETGEEHCGYTGEGVVLEATARGLQTCWIGGSFSRSVARSLVDLREGEEVRAVSPVGYAVSTPPAGERLLFGAGREKHRKPLEEIAPGYQSWPDWAKAGVDAAQLAPSAVNRQPWRFRLEDGSVVVSASARSLPGVSVRLDCGIAMLHFELGARGHGGDGTWESLRGPDIARWESRL
jgi:hypothetical protein